MIKLLMCIEIGMCYTVKKGKYKFEFVGAIDEDY